jgi:hypothetical protein
MIGEDPHAGPIKIGYAKGEPFEGDWMRVLMNRLRDAQLGNHRRLMVVGLCSGTIEQERALHAVFRSHRLMNEWFARDGNVLSFVEQHAVNPIVNHTAAVRRGGPASERTSLDVERRIAKAWSKIARSRRGWSIPADASEAAGRSRRRDITT